MKKAFFRTVSLVVVVVALYFGGGYVKSEMEDKAEMRRAELVMYHVDSVLRSAVSWPFEDKEWGERFLEIAIIGDEARSLRNRIRDGGRALRDVNGRPYEADEIMVRLLRAEEVVRRKGYPTRNSP